MGYNIQKKDKLEEKKRIVLDVIIFLVIFMLTFIYSKTHQEHDSIYDFRMKYQNLSSLEVVFRYGNGRFLGNLFGIICIPHKFLLSIIKAVVSVLIIELTSYLFEFKKIYRFIFLIGVGLMTRDFFFQMFYYSSSFFNYILPLLFLLINLTIILKKQGTSYLAAFVIGIVGFLGEFFIEHIAIFNVFIAFCFTIFYKKKNKLRFVYSLIWMITSGLGFAIMILYPYLFVKEPLEHCHEFTRSLSLLIYNMGQMLVSVYLGNLVLGLVAAFLYVRYDCIMKNTKEVSKDTAIISVLLFMSVIGGEGTLLFSPVLMHLLHKKYKIICRKNILYIYIYSIVYLSTLLFLFVDFRGESMCLQFSNFCETILWVLIFQHNQIHNLLEKRWCLR